MKNILAAISILIVSGCASPDWQATQHHDEFTNKTACRIERGTQGGREFTRALTGIYFTQHFYAENHNGEVRAGVRIEPPIPIGGDIQIKTANNLYTLTAEDAPLDVAPAIPAPANSAALPKDYDKTVAAMTKNIQRYASPYRAYTGDRAKALLRDILATNGEVKFRTVGVNAATSNTGAFTADEKFRSALTYCGINL